MERIRGEHRAHLTRLAVWSAVCVLACGTALFSAWSMGGPSGLWTSFLTWMCGWCLVNLAICGLSWFGKPPGDLRKLREFLMLNEGLNVGYLGVGVALGLASREPSVQGAGWAVAVQGLALIVLDAWYLARLPCS